MRLIEVDDRARLEAWLRRDPAMHLYELGDLDDFFWPRTRWYGLPAADDDSARSRSSTQQRAAQSS
jgi:hypothetical protein